MFVSKFSWEEKMESLKLKIIEGYIFNEDEAKKSQCIVEKIT